MKLLTADEVRGLDRKNDDPVAKVIRIINKRITERQLMGHKSALIGYAGQTEEFAKLPPTDREELTNSLKLAKFRVLNGPAPKTIVVHWDDKPEDDFI